MQIKLSGLIYLGMVLFFVIMTAGVCAADDVNMDFVSHIGGVVLDVAVSGDYAYIGEGQDLVVLDISDASNPSEVGRVTTPSIVNGVAVADGYAYVAGGEGGLMIVDVSVPSSPTLAGSYDHDAYSVVVAGDYAYVGVYNGFDILDITNQSSPQRVGRYIHSYYPAINNVDVAVSGNYAYVTLRSNFEIVDISNPSSPSRVGSYNSLSIAVSVAVLGDYAYVADSQKGLVIVDISNPASPTLAGSYDTGSAYDVAVLGDYAYVADGQKGLVIVNITVPSSPTLAASYDYDSAGFAFGVAVSGKYAYVADSQKGLVIVNITVASSPTFAGSYNTIGEARDVFVAGNYAYVADTCNGLVTIDITNPSSPKFAGRYDIGSCTYDVLISGNYAYIADHHDGLIIVDITNPSSPKFTGSYDTGDAHSVALAGNYAYVADLSNGLVIVDITNPSSPTFVGRYKTGYLVYSVEVAGNYAYIADRDIGLIIVDITNPSSPILAGSYRLGGITFDLDVADNYAYIGNMFNGGSSFLVVDVINPSSPTIVGRYDGIIPYNVDIAGNYAYIGSFVDGPIIVDITNSTFPRLAGRYDAVGTTVDFSVVDNYAYVADGNNGLVILRTDIQDQEPTEEYLVKVEGNSEVYLIQNGMKRHFTSPEALEWNGHSFSDVIEVSSETLASIPDGADISISQAIIDKYYALGGSATFGQPVGTGELNGESDSAGNYCSYVNFQNGAIDCFKNGPHVGEAYAVLNPLFTKWGELGYGAGILGYPIGDMSDVQILDSGTRFKYQNFANGDEKGALEYNLTSGKVFEIHGAIFAKWEEKGFAEGVMGLVTGDEKVAAPSPFGTVGKYSEFENGHIHWISDKEGENVGHSQRGKSFVTYGALDSVYTSLLGTGGDLGFPIMDQEDRDGHGYCEFEGGNIEWDYSEGAYKVNLPTTNTLPTTNPLSVTNTESFTPTISWTYNNDEGDPQQQYQLEVWTGPGGTGINKLSTAQSSMYTSVTYAGYSLIGGNTYYVRVRAFDGSNWGGWSETSFVPYNDLVSNVEKEIAAMLASDPMKYYDAKEASYIMNTMGILKKEEYDSYIRNVKIYRSLQSTMLQYALTQAKEGNTAKVDRDLNLATIYGKNAVISFENAFNLYNSILNNGIFVAKEVQTASLIAFKIVGTAYGLNPQALFYLEMAVTTYDGVIIDGNTVTQVSLDVARDAIFESIINIHVFPSLEGKTVAEYISSPELWRSHTDKEIYLTLSNALKSDEAATIVFSELQKQSPDIPQELATQIWEQITNQIDKQLNSEFTYQEISIKSPGELRVYDSDGNITGLVNGEIVEDIPNSIYDAENKSVIILGADDTYRYEVVGTGIGEYGLDILSVNGTEYSTVSLQNTVIPNEVHQYTVDWDSVSTERAVTLNIDSNGDGTFDQNVQIQLPTASFTDTRLTNSRISFDGSSSEGNIVSYKWDLGDGTTDSGKIVDHIYHEEGDYVVTLTVENDNRVIDSKTRNIRIGLTPPITQVPEFPTIALPVLSVIGLLFVLERRKRNKF